MRIRHLQQCVFGIGLLGLMGCHLLQIGDKLNQPEKKTVPEARAPQPPAPNRYQWRVSQFVFHSDVQYSKDKPLFQELEKLRDQVYRELKLPESQTLVQVFLFEDRDQYERYMKAKYPDLPPRRAFFVAQPWGVGGSEDLNVYTYWGDRIREDLRHELTHALLHSVLRDVPLWLDEGLAEYFEVPADWNGINYTHLDQIRRGAHGLFRPDLARLEKLSQIQQMAPAEYREAWAWVHLMLRGRADGKEVLVQYLQQLRTNPTPGPLEPLLAGVYPSLDRTLTKHLGQVDELPRPRTLLVR